MDCSARGKPVRRTMVACCLHRVVEQENVTVQSSVRRMTPEPVVILTFDSRPNFSLLASVSWSTWCGC